MSKDNKKMIALELPQELYLHIKKLAEKDSRSLSGYIRLCLEKYTGYEKETEQRIKHI